MRSIRLRTATKERPENAAFKAPAVAFAFNRPIVIRPPGRISIVVMLQRWLSSRRRSKPETTTSLSEPSRLRGASVVRGKGSLRGGAEGGSPHYGWVPLDAALKRSYA